MSLEFYYGAMNVGKSTTLLQMAHNLRERQFSVELYIPSVIGSDTISSRVGLKANANVFDNKHDFSIDNPPSYMMIDEAQFLQPAQVWQLSRLSVEKSVNILCFGIRTDFQGNLFGGSSILLGIADELVELKSVCSCGKKVTMNARMNKDGSFSSSGPQIEIDQGSYISLCRHHWTKK